MTYIELNHILENGTHTYKGLPEFKVCDFWTREESKSVFEDGSSFHIGQIEMVTNSGTYLDTPFHRFEEGEDLAAISLDRLTGLEGIVIRTPDPEIKAVDEGLFYGLDLKDKAVLVHTGWDRHWGSPAYFEHHPFLTEKAARYLVSAGVALVGIDSHNIDDTAFPRRPVHTHLLGAGILIVEHLCNLDQLPDRGFQFHALPPRIKGVGTFPVRAYASISE